MKINFTLLILVISSIIGCNSEFNSIEQARNEVNKNGYREGRWVDFLDRTEDLRNEFIIDTTKGYDWYYLTEFQDGRIVGEVKKYLKNGTLVSVGTPYQEDTLKYTASLTMFNPFFTETTKSYNENGQVTKSVKLSNDPSKPEPGKKTVIEENWYSTSGNKTGSLIKSETSTWACPVDGKITLPSLSKVEGVIFNENGVEIKYHIDFYSSDIKTNEDFRQIFEKKLAQESEKMGIPDSFLIKKDNISQYPYSIETITYNNRTLKVRDLIRSEAEKYIKKINAQNRSLVSCKYCGRNFDKSNGFVFNINVTIDHATSYSHYDMVTSSMNTMGVSANFLNKFSNYYCSQRCCNLSGYRVWDY
jgi:hypothetical protein